jgi:hypothetical protein
MMKSRPLMTPSGMPPAPPTLPSATNLAATSWARELFWQADAIAPRSVQTHVGPSEVANPCERALAHQLRGDEPIRPTKGSLSAITGSGLHAWVADRIATMYDGTGRYLVETPVEYRGITGTSDLLDRLAHRVVDWKTVTESRLRQYAAKPVWKWSWIVQANIYGAGFEAAGETVEEVAIGLVPREGHVDSILVLTRPYDRSIADKAIDRLYALRGVDPLSLPICDERYCDYCPR